MLPLQARDLLLVVTSGGGEWGAHFSRAVASERPWKEQEGHAGGMDWEPLVSAFVMKRLKLHGAILRQSRQNAKTKGPGHGLLAKESVLIRSYVNQMYAFLD